MYVLSSGDSGNSLESRVLGLFSWVLSPSASALMEDLRLSSGMETHHKVSLSASISLKSFVFSVLMSFLKSPMVLVGSTSTGTALVVASPSTRQNRVRGLLFMAL